MALADFSVTFPAATSDWGAVTHIGAFNAQGVLLASVALTNTPTVNKGDTLNFSGDIDYGGGNSSRNLLYENMYVGAGGAGSNHVSGGGAGGCLTSQLTTTSGTGTYMYVDASNYKKEEDMSEVCQFCGEPKVREITEKKLVMCGKGKLSSWETRTTYYYNCGTSKTIGTYKVKPPRVRIGKACVGFKK